ncbi:predicted protein [Naegleria gruberi]|uniref:Predicted protein n=1 Tax=Naegleria gruberi TaxID=5762 RepID=D2V198_NAEGR|nr:uncharacterized protein NAEGRDRAFT_46029 [Naegleria gruberi]EFC49270.1 predicted protein [Naegleria gruberi]|eukprot:XP_002682014.1 predicted protein [Naegleria gruberi strain NEG-M]
MTATYCLVIQLFSDEDWMFVNVSQTENFKIFTNHRLPDNVRFRLFCYFQDMGELDFDIEPTRIFLTRNGSEVMKNCSDGQVNEKLDEMISDSYWNFTRRKQFQQYFMKITELNVEIPLRIDNLTNLQMHVMPIDIYGYPENVGMIFTGSYYVIPLFTNYSTQTSPYWESQCNDLTYNTRSQYYIWKLIAISIGALEFSIILILLFYRRKHIILESRFIIPHFSTCMYILQCVVNIILNVIYYDPKWDTMIEELVLIIVMSLHLLQGCRYYASRLFYSRFYSKRDGLMMKILLSKIPFLIAIVTVVLLEGGIVTALIIKVPITEISTFYDSISIVCGVSYMILLGIGLLAHFISHFKFVRKLRKPKQIMKWFFLYDDAFGYNGEFLVFVIIWILAGIHFVISEICGDYLTISLYDETRPLSKKYLNNGFGYALYGITKIMSTMGFGLQYLFLITMTFVKKRKFDKSDFRHQKDEMDMFISKIFNDGSICVEILKRFLMAEFKLELLEIYLFLTENPKSTLMNLVKQHPQNYFAIIRYFKKSNLESEYQICYRESTELLLEVFTRLKQTVVYEEEYVKKMAEEMQFVLDTIK